jgi:hypothetical protein
MGRQIKEYQGPQILSEPPGEDTSASPITTPKAIQCAPSIESQPGGRQNLVRLRPERAITTGDKQTHSCYEAFAIILDPLRRKEGFRHGWLGDSRTGKTYANALLVDAALRVGISIAIIIDDKLPVPQYAGSQRANVRELWDCPVSKGTDHYGSPDISNRIVLRGAALRTGQRVDTDQVAALLLDNWARLPSRPMVLASIDELRRAVSPGGMAWRGKDLPRLFTEGGGLGVSVSYTTQTPQRIPTEAIDQTETFGLFRMTGRGARYITDMMLLNDEIADLLPTLQVRQWILVSKGEPWNGKIYQC